MSLFMMPGSIVKALSSPIAVMAAFGRQLGKATPTLAFQNIFYLAPLTTITAVVPAIWTNRFQHRGRVGG